MTLNTFQIEATDPNRTYYEGPTDSNGNERIRQRYFTYISDQGLVAGIAISVHFSLDAPAKVVWPVLSDFNVWQNRHNHVYSGVLRELEGKTFGLRIGPNDRRPHYYEVVKVIPEYLLVINQPVPTDGTSAGFPGKGGVSPGFHVFMLNEHDGKTTVSVYMEHSAVATTNNVAEALAPWRDQSRAPEIQRKWREDFFGTIKELVAGAGLA